MEMVVIVDAGVAPVVKPIVPPEAGFDGAGEIGVLIGRHGVPVNEQRQAAVGHHSVGARPQRFETVTIFSHFCAPFPSLSPPKVYPLRVGDSWRGLPRSTSGRPSKILEYAPACSPSSVIATGRRPRVGA